LACVPKKAPAVGTMLLSGIMLKMGLYSIIRWHYHCSACSSKEYMYIFISLSCLIYGSIVALKKRLKETISLLLAHVDQSQAGAYNN
jgi:NADH-quinone oxidoreductase subunit M